MGRLAPSSRTASARPGATPPAPAWVERVALVSALSPVASSVWRLPLILGISWGMSDEMLASMMDVPLWLRAGYLIGLGVLSDGLAFLTLGLCRWWGETFPRWVPLVGGRPVPTWFAAPLAMAGGSAPRPSPFSSPRPGRPRCPSGTHGRGS